jgi:site-specific DNA-methyltransferase (adenine-specific)
MITLHNKDCLEAMLEMETDQFDLAIVDPPYGIKKHGHKEDKKFGWKHYTIKSWDAERPSQQYFDELKRVSKNQIIWGGNYFADLLCASRGWVYWSKGQPGLDMSDGELAWTSFDRTLREITINRCKIKQHGGSIHPTQKPVALYKWLLQNYAKDGDSILDTHLGSGSIAIACHDMGFDLTAFEIDEEYFDAASKRLKEHQRQLKLF